jgi:putative oxidoreductase
MIPDRYAPRVYALFRIVFGLMFLSHGLQKLFGMFGGLALFGGQLPSLASEPGIAGLIELVLGSMIMLGLFTRVAAFIASGEMAVAYFKGHQPMALWPLENQGEMAVLFCFAFLYMSARGAGVWSVDAWRHITVDLDKRR